MNERQAIRLIKQGDPTGLKFLVNEYQLIALRAVYLIVHDRAIAEEIVQSAFIKVFERIAQFDDTRPFKPWFLRIVVNDALKRVSRQKQMVSIDENTEHIDFEALIVDRSQKSLEKLIEEDELRQAVWDALEALPSDQRTAVVMHYYLGLSQPEIAQSSDTALGTIKWRLHAARQRLHDLLAGVF